MYAKSKNKVLPPDKREKIIIHLAQEEVVLTPEKRKFLTRIDRPAIFWLDGKEIGRLK
jgi:hypothetical protein